VEEEEEDDHKTDDWSFLSCSNSCATLSTSLSPPPFSSTPSCSSSSSPFPFVPMDLEVRKSERKIQNVFESPLGHDPPPDSHFSTSNPSPILSLYYPPHSLPVVNSDVYVHHPSRCSERCEEISPFPIAVLLPTVFPVCFQLSPHFSSNLFSFQTKKAEFQVSVLNSLEICFQCSLYPEFSRFPFHDVKECLGKQLGFDSISSDLLDPVSDSSTLNFDKFEEEDDDVVYM
ncbi:MAG: hypothetical protein ACK56F_00660, partial [bacterium]